MSCNFMSAFLPLKVKLITKNTSRSNWDESAIPMKNGHPVYPKKKINNN